MLQFSVSLPLSPTVQKKKEMILYHYVYLQLFQEKKLISRMLHSTAYIDLDFL